MHSSRHRHLGRHRPGAARSTLRLISRLCACTVGVVAAAGVWLATRYARGRRRAEAAAAADSQAGLHGLRTVTELRILPLVDAEAQDGLRAEHGVSYLVVADGLTLLFDVGLSPGRQARLLHNAEALGVDLARINLVVISHAHPDHCGGLRVWLHRSFALPGQVPPGIRVITPMPMRHRFARCEYAAGARVIGPGIATTGTIPRMLFLLGWTPEQALMVNVRDKGIVVIVGCGHQGLRRLMSRVEALTQAPIHAVVGGLHLPVHGLRLQEIIGSAKWPWQRTTEQDVTDAINILRQYRPQLVAVSPHDSSAWTLARFATAFADDYHRIRVGDEIRISADSPA